jgi:hypothetical protein
VAFVRKKRAVCIPFAKTPLKAKNMKYLLENLFRKMWQKNTKNILFDKE